MRRALGWTFLVLLGTGACAGSAPFELYYHVLPTPEGVDIRVDVRGGPRSVAWVGFGSGPGAPVDLIDRIEAVAARSASDQALPVTSLGRGGFRVDLAGSEDWRFYYRLDLTPIIQGNAYYRTSSQTPDYLILVGSDAWARFYPHRSTLAADVADRPAGPVTTATVVFDLSHTPDDWRVVSSVPATENSSFLLTEHPVNSVFAVGPYEVHGEDRAAMEQLIVALHRDWKVERDSVDSMSRKLHRKLADELGPSGTGWALALLSPLAQENVPSHGLRTAGMVRGRTLLLFAGASPDAPIEGPKVREAVVLFLGHELFHLYLPWGVRIAPDLGWLSEGWAMRMGRRTARTAGFITSKGEIAQLREIYRRYIEIGGYRAGSLPAASMTTDHNRDLLYLRGELVFQLLSREWESQGNSESFDAALWGRLSEVYRGSRPLDAEQVRAILEHMVDPGTVRRFVEGTAPLTPKELGLQQR